MILRLTNPNLIIICSPEISFLYRFTLSGFFFFSNISRVFTRRLSPRQTAIGSKQLNARRVLSFSEESVPTSFPHLFAAATSSLASHNRWSVSQSVSQSVRLTIEQVDESIDAAISLETIDYRPLRILGSRKLSHWRFSVRSPRSTTSDVVHLECVKVCELRSIERRNWGQFGFKRDNSVISLKRAYEQNIANDIMIERRKWIVTRSRALRESKVRLSLVYTGLISRLRMFVVFFIFLYFYIINICIRIRYFIFLWDVEEVLKFYQSP